METKSYRVVVDSFSKQLAGINQNITNINLAEDKWSLREIIGHLIDSASNNHQRFVRLQFDDLLDFPAYSAEQWIKTQKYNTVAWGELYSLWYIYNSLLLHVIENIDDESLGNVWVKGEDAFTLEELIKDYYRHMELHIEHFNSRLKELA